MPKKQDLQKKIIDRIVDISVRRNMSISKKDKEDVQKYIKNMTMLETYDYWQKLNIFEEMVFTSSKDQEH